MMSATRSLEDVAQEFHRIRSEKNGRPRFPCELWQAACELAHTHPIAEIALALGVQLQYFKKRLSMQKGTSQTFVKVHPLAPEFHAFVEITLKRQSGPLTLRWTGPTKDLPTLISRLFRGEFS